MKTRLLSIVLLSAFFISSLFLSSCGSSSDDPQPHIVAAWKLDGYAFMNVPSAYSKYNEGRTFAIEDISFGNTVYEAYTLTLNGDNTYTRKIEISGPNVNDDGTWELDGNDFNLMSDDFGDENYSLEKNEDDQFWISEQIQFPLIPDAVLDTLQQSTLDNMTQEEIDALFDLVNLDFVYTFEK